jgi:hypothetical protein
MLNLVQNLVNRFAMNSFLMKLTASDFRKLDHSIHFDSTLTSDDFSSMLSIEQKPFSEDFELFAELDTVDISLTYKGIISNFTLVFYQDNENPDTEVFCSSSDSIFSTSILKHCSQDVVSFAAFLNEQEFLNGNCPKYDILALNNFFASLNS